MVNIRGEAIKELIPQREPMLMIDTFYDATVTETDTGYAVTEADTGYTVAKDSLFCSDYGFEEPGLVEHIAQSASAMAGYKAKLTNEPTPLGFIGEVKKCRIHFLPRAGDELRTHIRILSELFGVSLLAAETKVNGELAVQCQMKIFIKPS